MKSNYDILGNHIRLIDTRNRESITDRVLGINIDKFFMPSVANAVSYTHLDVYKRQQIPLKPQRKLLLRQSKRLLQGQKHL